MADISYGLDTEGIKNRVRALLKLTVPAAQNATDTHSGDPQPRVFNSVTRVNSYIDAEIAKHARVLDIREAEIKIREEACTRIIVEYQKRIAELESILNNKEK